MMIFQIDPQIKILRSVEGIGSNPDFWKICRFLNFSPVNSSIEQHPVQNVPKKSFDVIYSLAIPMIKAWR
jgi:hypothetical protein